MIIISFLMRIFFYFCNEVKDEWINSLQVDFSTSQTLNDASGSDNDQKMSNDKDNIDLEVREQSSYEDNEDENGNERKMKKKDKYGSNY